MKTQQDFPIGCMVKWSGNKYYVGAHYIADLKILLTGFKSGWLWKNVDRSAVKASAPYLRDNDLCWWVDADECELVGPAEMPAMEEIQAEAKRRYPIGCKYKCANAPEHGLVSILDEDSITYSIKNEYSIWAHEGGGCLYYNGKWATLVDMPKQADTSSLDISGHDMIAVHSSPPSVYTATSQPEPLPKIELCTPPIVI